MESHKMNWKLERLALCVGIVLMAFYLATSFLIALRRPFWYDEVFSVLVARLPDWTTMRRALAAGVDSMPVGFYLLVRASEFAFGRSDLSARLPSVLALTIGLVITWDAARRLTDNLNGLAAIALLTSSLLPFYGYEARPYSLYFMFVALGLWLWQNTPDTKLWPLAFGLSTFAAFSVHFYSALCLLPYFAFEYARTGRLRIPSVKLIAGVAGVFCGLLVSSRQILAFREFSHQFWATPSLSGLLRLFEDYFPFLLAILAVALLWGALRPEPNAIQAVPMTVGERVGWLFLLIPIAGYIVAKLVTNAFYNRYFIGMLPGVAIASACLLQRFFRHRPFVSAGIIVIALSCGVGKQMMTLLHAETVGSPSLPNAASRLADIMFLETPMLNEGKSTIVLRADDTLGLEARYYSRHPESYAFLVEPGIEVTGKINMRLATFSPMRFWSMEDLRLHAREAALVDPSQSTLDWLSARGYEVKVRSKDVGVYYFY